MAKANEIVEKVNNGEIVKFSMKYWPIFNAYLLSHKIEFKCHMVIDGGNVLLGPKQIQGPKQIS